MTTIPTAAPEIKAAPDPVQPQGGARDRAGTDHADEAKFDSVMKSEETALKKSATGLRESETALQESQQGEDTPKPDGFIAMPETVAIAAETAITALPGAETPQAKNNPGTITLPATGSPGETNALPETVVTSAETKTPPAPGVETQQTKNNPQSPEDTTVLSVLKDQEKAINTSAEREKLAEAFKQMAGTGGKEIKNFSPNNVEETAGESIFKNQTDISLKNSDQTGRVNDIENTNPGSGSTISSGSQKPADKPFVETVQRPSGFNEVLDKVVYVVKNNRSMDVSVMHEGNRLKINLTMDKGMLNVNINTNETAMRDLLENNIRDIIDSLEKDGVNISEFSVNLKEKKQHHNRENTFDNDMPGRKLTPPAHIRSVNSGTGAVNIFA